MTVINPNSISGITSITLPSGDGNVLTIHTNDGVERFRIDSSGNVKVGSACTISQDGDVFFTGVCTATTLTGAASGLTGALPAISAANLTNVPAANITGTLPAISGANLTSLPAGNLTGALPAISGANLTGIAATDNVRTGILDVAGISTFRNTVNIGAAVTISESGIEASGIGITCANINGTQIGGRKNLFDNGAMLVAQRGAAAAQVDGIGSVDRFKLQQNSVTNHPTQSQVDVASGTTPYSLGFRKALKLINGDNSVGTDDILVMKQVIEAQNMAGSGWNYTSSSSYITLSFWIKSSVAQNFYMYVRTYDGTAQIYPMETGSLTADTWTKIVKTIPGNSNLQFDNDEVGGFEVTLNPYLGTDRTDAGVSLNAWAAYGSGTTRTPNQTSTWYTTNSATLEFTGYQLEVGPQTTAFEHRSFGQELSLCQRYYYRHAEGANGANIGIAAVYQSNNIFPVIHFPCTMRTTPSLDVADGTGYFRVYSNGDSDAFDTFSSLWNVGDNAVGVNAYSADGISGRTGGHAAMVITDHASSHISFSAEI